VVLGNTQGLKDREGGKIPSGMTWAEDIQVKWEFHRWVQAMHVKSSEKTNL
jgi:hypothetical protein